MIERWVNAVLADGASFDRQITYDAPAALYVEAACADCGHHGQYNAYSVTYCQVRHRQGAQAGARWPQWLLERLVPIRTVNDAVQEACLALDLRPGRVVDA